MGKPEKIIDEESKKGFKLKDIIKPTTGSPVPTINPIGGIIDSIIGVIAGSKEERNDKQKKGH